MAHSLDFYKSLSDIETDECILWPYAKATGYGALNIKGVVCRVHALVCNDRHGSPPTSSYQAGHTCGNRACVNYRHIRWVTQSENEKDKILHNRVNYGERNGQSKLTSNDVKEIRKLIKQNVSFTDIAKQFSISRTTVYDILSKRRWSHLKE